MSAAILATIFADFGEALSNEDIKGRLLAALGEDLAASPMPGVYWPEILHVWGDESKGNLIHSGPRGQVIQRSYSISTSKAGQKVTLGDRVLGYLNTSFIKADKRGVQSDGMSEAITLQENAIAEACDVLDCNDGIDLSEAVSDSGVVKRIKVRLIKPGWGSSGYYPREVLERDGPKIFTKGMHMFWNHDTPLEEMQRPEGDLNKLAAVLETDAKWEKDGLYATAEVKQKYGRDVADLAKDIGVSIRAGGTYKLGKVGGREGKIIQSLETGKSTDFVTRAGAGGAITQLFESAGRRGGEPTERTNTQMDEDVKKMFAALTESSTSNAQAAKVSADAVKVMSDQMTRLIESNNRNAANTLYQNAIAGSSLPTASKAKLSRQPFTGVIESGVLNEASTVAAANQIVLAEAAYLKDLGVSPTGKSSAGATEGNGEELKEADVTKRIGGMFEKVDGELSSGAKIVKVQ